MSGAPRDDGSDDGDPAPAWIPLVGPEEAEGKLAETYRRIGAGSRISHVIGVHSLHPAAMEAHLRLYRTLMFGSSPLSRREREAVAVVVSAANDCFY